MAPGDSAIFLDIDVPAQSISAGTVNGGVRRSMTDDLRPMCFSQGLGSDYSLAVQGHIASRIRSIEITTS